LQGPNLDKGIRTNRDKTEWTDRYQMQGMMVPDLRNSASNNSNTIDHDKESFDEYGDEFNAHNLKLN